MRTPKVDTNAPEALGHQANRWKGAPQDTALGSRIVHLLAAVLLCAIAGVAIVRFPPLLVIGLAISLLFVVTVLVKPFWGLLLYTCIFLVQPAELYPVLGPLHLERIVGALTVIGMFFEQHRRDGRILIDGSRQTYLLLMFLAAVLLSVPFAYWRRGAMNGFIEVAKIVVFYVLVVHLLDTKKRLRTFIWVFSALTAYSAATSFVPYLQGSSHFAQGIDRAYGATSIAANANKLGTTMAVSIPLFLLLALHKSLGWSRRLFALGTPLLLATMAVTGSRASLLGFLGGMIYLWWTSRHRILLGILGVFLLCAGFLVLPEQYKTRYSTITQKELDGSSQARVATWMTGMRMVMDRPFFGVGIRCFGTAHAMGYSPESRRSWLEAHSLYVQVPAELGLLGAAIFFSFMLEFLRLNRRTAKELALAGDRWRFETVVLNALFAGFVVLLISGVFGHSLLRRTWYIYAGIGLSVRRLYLDALGTERSMRARP